MSTTHQHIAVSPLRETEGKRRAVLLFARTPASEARTKRIDGLSYAQRLALFRTLTARALRHAVESRFDVVVATDGRSTLFDDARIANRLRQRGRSFGERIACAVSDTFALGYDEVVVIGNDCPGLDGNAIRAGLAEREPGEVGLVPAPDGGVTLIALDSTSADHIQDMFATPRWETGHLFDDLAQAARTIGLPVSERYAGSQIPDDIDSAADIIRAGLASSAPPLLTSLAFELVHRIPLRLPLGMRPIPSPRRTILRTRRQKAPPHLFA